MRKTQKYLKDKKYYISPKIKVKRVKISSFYRLDSGFLYDNIGNGLLLADGAIGSCPDFICGSFYTGWC